jgi:TRAP-type mannitol/chloroaromatic compound transport system substrate-binding protein
MASGRVHYDDRRKVMERRQFLRGAATGAAVIGLTACTGSAVTGDGGSTEDEAQAAGGGEEGAEQVALDSSLPEIDIEMATSWPLGLDTIFGGAQVFSERVAAMTGGRFTITPRAGGELVPALEVLDAVQSGGVPIGHTASYYYVGKTPVMGFGTALPFGLTDRQQNAWLFDNGGLEMLQEIYAERFNVIQFPAGNTGVQMGGWFNKEINGINDIRGLTMRIPGLGGEVMSRLGATVQVIAGGEIFQALDTGAIDAAEWVGPYDDEKLGLQNAARFYYYPGWWEPGPTLEVQMSLDQWNELPTPYQEIVRTAAHEANTIMMARYDVRNPAALQSIEDSGVELRPFPDDVMSAAKDASFELYDEFASSDSDFQAVYEEWDTYRQSVQAWHGLAELAMLQQGVDSGDGGGGSNSGG